MGWKCNLLLCRLPGDATAPSTSIDVERSRALASELGLTRYREVDPLPLHDVMSDTRRRAVMVGGAVAVVVDDRLASDLIEGTVPRPLARLFDAGVIEEALAVWVYENAGDLGAFALVRSDGIVRRWSSLDGVVDPDDGAPLVAEIMVRDADPDLDDQAALFAMAVASYILGEPLDQWDGLEADALVFDSSLTPE